MTKTHALPQLICSVLGDRAFPPLGMTPTHTTSTVPAWTPAEAVGPRARMHPAGRRGALHPAQPTYLFSWRADSTLGTRKTLVGEE